MAIKSKEIQKHSKMFLLDHALKRQFHFASLEPNVISKKSQIGELSQHATKDSLWVSYASDLTNALMKNMPNSHSSLGLGLFIHPLDVNLIPVLSSRFRSIAYAANGGFLCPEELTEVFEADNRDDLFIGCNVDVKTETITFWRGNLKPLTVAFNAFGISGDGTKPNFEKCCVIDSGLTVQLGDYEAAVDAILYENDPEYRRRLSKLRLQEDQSFGASLRRLRKQRGLRREDFEPGLNSKTIARIEQGKVKRIHVRTRNILSQRLGVEPSEIETF
ncbi:MAG: helix-turn-helix domain-containing protein [Planctomycetaceae bacterium]|nr:helix-turn-helix domain-containing protein [Planctomycetaceae bacterium]